MKDERTLIRIEHVEFRYRRDPVLVDIQLEIQAGDFLAVIGPNGSGKTALIKIMLGLLEPVRGAVSLFGTPIRDFREWEKVGYVPQKATHFDPDPQMTGRRFSSCIFVMASRQPSRVFSILELNPSTWRCMSCGDSSIENSGVDGAP